MVEVILLVLLIQCERLQKFSNLRVKWHSRVKNMTTELKAIKRSPFITCIGLATLAARRQNLTNKLFKNTVNDPENNT